MYRTSDPGSILIAAFADKVFGIDRGTGAIRWRVQITTLVTGLVEIAVDDDVVIAVTPTHIAFIDYATGALRKRIDRRDKARNARAILLLADGHLYIGGTGQIACYSVHGDLVWDQGFKGEGYGEVALGLPHRVRQADGRG